MDKMVILTHAWLIATCIRGKKAMKMTFVTSGATEKEEVPHMFLPANKHQP